MYSLWCWEELSVPPVLLLFMKSFRYTGICIIPWAERPKGLYYNTRIQLALLRTQTSSTMMSRSVNTEICVLTCSQIDSKWYSCHFSRPLLNEALLFTIYYVFALSIGCLRQSLDYENSLLLLSLIGDYHEASNLKPPPSDEGSKARGLASKVASSQCVSGSPFFLGRDEAAAYIWSWGAWSCFALSFVLSHHDVVDHD